MRHNLFKPTQKNIKALDYQLFTYIFNLLCSFFISFFSLSFGFFHSLLRNLPKSLSLSIFLYLFSPFTYSAIQTPSASPLSIQMLVPPAYVLSTQPLILEFLANQTTRDHSENANASNYSIQIPKHLQIDIVEAHMAATVSTITMQLIEETKPSHLFDNQIGLTKVRYKGQWPQGINGAVSLKVQNTDFSPVNMMVSQSPSLANHLSQLDKPILPLSKIDSTTANSTTTVANNSFEDKDEDESDKEINNENYPRFAKFSKQHMFSYHPIYFGIGHNNTTSAQFQFSFQYRIFAPSDLTSKNLFKNLYFAYTQTSLWDLSAFSKPFRDTSYKPALFYFVPDFGLKNSLIKSVGVRSGFEHESNGRGGSASRSLNIAFVEPILSFRAFEDDTLSFMPKFIYYLEKSENPDITQYRGYTDIVLRYHRQSNWYLMTTYRQGMDKSKRSINAQLSYPLRKLLNKKVGGYLWINYFNGYGETLLDYNVRNRWIVRIGYSLVP